MDDDTISHLVDLQERSVDLATASRKLLRGNGNQAIEKELVGYLSGVIEAARGLKRAGYIDIPDGVLPQ